MENQAKESKQPLLKHWQVVTAFLVIYDAIAILASFFAALWIRFDCRVREIPPEYWNPFLKCIPIYIVVSILVYRMFRLYQSIWRFAGYTELIRISLANLVTLTIHIVFMTAFVQRMPVSYYLVGTLLQYGFTLAVRLGYRFVLLLRSSRKSGTEKPVMLIGAGEAGQLLLRDLNKSKKVKEKVCCIIDDNPNKWDRYVAGVRVAGGRESIPECCKKYQIEKIYLAIPSASKKDKAEILNICKDCHCELLNLPSMYQFYSGEITLKNMRKVSVEELLGREPIKVNNEEIFAYLKEKTILVTGAGGSIGSELSRQIAAHHPKKLILLDIYENSVYDVQQEFKKKYPDLDLVVLIASVRDSRKMFKVFSTYRPDIVYHAAAHKHVPLMEDSPCEAVKNNALGTYKTAYAAMVHGCQRFVLISTDKAVNPTNIMGASKRICEMIIQAFDAKIKQGKADEIPQIFTHSMKEVVENPEIAEALKTTKTEFVAVRFGNVLGSNGSVIPLFQKQIAEGGPVTVTHPDIIRYFMTIPEAVSLVLQAGTYAKGGEIFVLDMGDPVKIDTLARNLISLSGHVPDVDIKVVYTGLRPGEKLYEEKLMAEEGLQNTENDLIHIGAPIPFNVEVFLQQFESLVEDAYKNRSYIRQEVKEIVPTYRPTEK